VLAERSNGTFSIPVHEVLDNGANTVAVLATHSAQRDDRERQGAGDDEARGETATSVRAPMNCSHPAIM
jgi:hypothetical protein